MSKNEETNKLIRQAIDSEMEAIFASRGPDDPEVLTYDGIISDEDSAPDLLFLLKEANDGRNNRRQGTPDFSNPYNFVDHAREDALKQENTKPKHWDNLCYWAKAYEDAINGTSLYFTDDSVQKCGGILKKIALVNIKKVPGGAVVDPRGLISTVASERCRELIRNEISLISPKIVVCCGTYEHAKTIYQIRSSDETILPSGMSFFLKGSIFFLEFIHPTQYGAAAKRCMVYAFAKEVFKSLIEKKQF